MLTFSPESDFFTGMYELGNSGQMLPILVGTTMTDRAGSGMEVPILGAEKSKLTGKIVPLGGTMEDPEGAGKYFKVSISYDSQMFLF